MIVAMICLVLASALLGTLLKMTSIGRSQAKIEAQALQADWLVESALERAAAKLAGDPAYEDETWNVSADDLGGRHSGRVVIKILPSETSGHKTIEAVAEYPFDQTPSAKRSKRIEIKTNPPDEKPAQEEQTPAPAEKPAR